MGSIISGQSLGHYRVLDKIGEGGMGEVYRAQDTKLDRTVAIKILPSEFAEDIERRNRFVKEAKAASAIDHSNVATIHEISEADGVHFIVMQYVDGETLAARMKRGSLRTGDVIDVGIQVADALDAAQSKGIVHRDIKPANLVLTERDQVKVLDFGLAKTVGPSDSAHDSDATTGVKTGAGLVMGTVQYMSPEQALGRDVDTRSDIFSLGIVLYEMTTGRLPFAGKTSTETIEQIRHAQPEAIARFNYDASPELERCIRKCLEKDAGNRYQSAKDLFVDLRNLKRDTESGAVAATPARPARGSNLTIAAAALIAVASGLAWLLWPSAPSVQTEPNDQISSLAVLPFENGSGDPDAEYFSDGVTETIISSLSRLPGIRVISRASAFRYKGRGEDPSVVGEELGVDALVLGRIVQRGEDLTVSAELVRAGDSGQIWGDQYRRKVADVFSIQEDIAREISEALRVQLNEEQGKQLTKQHTASPDAYQAYLKGRHHWNRRTEEGFRQAIVHFEQAIDHDPTYAMAYTGLADTYSLLGYYSAPPRSVLPQARVAAERALELDPTLGAAHVSLGYVTGFYEWNFAEAEREYEKAIELNPVYPTAYQYYSHLLFATGRGDEAIEQMRLAVELDPLSRIINSNYGQILQGAGRVERGGEQLRKTLDLDPSWAIGHLRLGDFYAFEGEFAEAIAYYERAFDLDDTPFGLGALGFAFAKSGRVDEAREVLLRLDALSRSRHVSPVERAQVYAGLGELDKSFEWLDQAYDDRSSTLNHLRFFPFSTALEDDPRFGDLMRRIGVE